MRKVFLTVCAVCVLVFGVSTAFADWMPDDGHKMHYPQLPDVTGWDVNATAPVVLADDWMCSASGPVTDIHFWGSWLGGNTGEIVSFNLSIHADIPADPPLLPYSRPGPTLWEVDVPFSAVIAQPLVSDLDEGWYDPSNGTFNTPDHNEYWQYNVFLENILPPDQFFIQEEGTIYWLNISATVSTPGTTWGWKSSFDHWNDDAVWAFWGALQWVDMFEPPDFFVSLDLSFVITGPDELGACCYDDGTGFLAGCVQTTQQDCINAYMGTWEGPGTVCQGQEACCLPGGACINADALCCVNEMGGVPQGAGTVCGAPEACCFSDGNCGDLDPLCCIQLGGVPQGPGSMCSGPMACCLQDGSCIMVDPLCCDELGGFISPFSPNCLGDNDGDGTDDACQEPQEHGACCYEPTGGPQSLCVVTTQDSCVNFYFGVYQGDGTVCAGTEACCLPNGSCLDADALCCINVLGGTPQGAGTSCTGTQACCLQDGSCQDLDPLCCVQLGGTPQGAGTACSAATIACCMPDGTCMDVDPLCCDELGGFVSPYSNSCMGDLNQNTIDDACEEPMGACCMPDGTCSLQTASGCNNLVGNYMGDGTTCLGDSDGDGNDDACVDPWPDHKMHYPQLPDESGWDVNATAPMVVADDWMCSETGPVKDIHFWGSWRNGDEAIIGSFLITIYSDIPADPPQLPYSRPGNILWQYDFTDFDIMPYTPETMEGWYDPSTGEYLTDNHQRYYRYDIFLDEQLWFHQVEGTIYWISITANLVQPEPGILWGWKTSVNHWNDDAVWAPLPPPDGQWIELFEPPDPIANPFMVEMGPGNVIVNGFGGDAYGDGWYFYPDTQWWNIWFYDHPFTYDAYKQMHIDLPIIQPTGPEAFITIAFNWSTDIWSLEGNPPGPRRPPLPGDQPEEVYIGRQIIYSGIPEQAPPIFDFDLTDYNPEWVSIDIMGESFIIPDAVLVHDCRRSLDMAFVITNGPTGCSGKCGNANGDASVNVSDAVWVINFVFVGGPQSIPKACSDANGDCSVNVSDAVYIINFVFVGGPQPGTCCPGGPWPDGDCCPYTP